MGTLGTNKTKKKGMKRGAKWALLIKCLACDDPLICALDGLILKGR